MRPIDQRGGGAGVSFDGLIRRIEDDHEGFEFSLTIAKCFERIERCTMICRANCGASSRTLPFDQESRKARR
jgi:hypothetical protein